MKTNLIIENVHIKQKNSLYVHFQAEIMSKKKNLSEFKIRC